MASRYARIYPETIAFLEELSTHNNRDWFNENKQRYEEQVLDVALPTRVGGSLMRVYRDPLFKRHFSLGGESLQRPPRGFNKDHEYIDDIKRKSFIAVRDLDRDACLKPRFQRRVEESFKAAEPLMRFLCAAVGVRF